MGDGAIVDAAPADAARRAVDRSVRVRTEVAALSKAFDYGVPDSWSQDVRVGTRVRVPSARPQCAGMGRGGRRSSARRRRRPPAQVLARLGPAAQRRRPDGVGLVALGRPAVVLLAGRVAGHRRPCPAGRAALSPDPSPRPRRPSPVQTGACPVAGVGVEVGGGLGAGGRRDDAVAAGDGPDRPRALRRQPGRRHSRAGSVLVLVPSTGWAERLSARLVRRGYPVAGSWEEARAGGP